MGHRNLLCIALFAVSACASTPGARPLDMSASSHDAEARAHEGEAAAHAARFDSSAGEPRTRCLPNRVAGADVPCWTREENPTKEHLEHEADHKKMAADHRAAAQALRDAEARACGGIAEDDRDTSPLQRSADIVSVEPLTGAITGKRPVGSPEGAAVTIRAVPGLTLEYMQRLVACHAARNASMGFAMPEMTSCPLAVRGVTATVRSVEGGFRVEIRGEPADEILKRARALSTSR